MAKTLVEELTATGMQVDPYVRGPLGKDPFAIGIRPGGIGTLRVWEGSAEIEIATSKRHHQAVLEASEPAREITREVGVWARTAGDARLAAQQTFPVHFGGVRPSFHTETPVRTSDEPRGSADWRVYRFIVPTTAAVRGQHHHFLVGIDETHHFVAALPKAVNSVAEAHDLLRPRGVPKGTLRQGEWFFVPVSKRLSAQLDRRATRRLGALQSQALEPGSSHVALQCMTLNRDRQRYAIGYVVDHRRGRHTPLFLAEWHRVVRNREVVERARSSSRVMVPAMRRYWD